MEAQKALQLKEYIELRAMDEVKHSIPLEELLQQVNATKNELLEVWEDSADLHSQREVLSMDGRKYVQSHTIDEVNIVPFRDERCDCAQCEAYAKLQAYGRALTSASAARGNLEALISDLTRITPFQLEAERTKELAAEGGLYGRTGSYRGHGAGDLKIRGASMNSNAASRGQGSTTGYKKTAKKQKKPRLADYRGRG